MSQLRVAYLPDSYYEVNGVAHTSRHFEAFAKRRNLPFLIVHPGQRREVKTENELTSVDLSRGKASFLLDKDLSYDLLFWRQSGFLRGELRRFRPDVIHITGPSDLGMLGAAVAHSMKIPLVASWHTNLHEYAGRRTHKLTSWMPDAWRARIGDLAEQYSLRATARFYKLARVLLAPNQELIELLELHTKKPCFLMPRGVETDLFNPDRRDRQHNTFTIGYVGRLSAEKNVWFLAEIEKALLDAGLTGFKFLIVGQGVEENWLRANLKHVEFTGVLRGEALARAYANMDLFVFPSHTDTFGNVVLEALASGVPAVVTSGGGPKFLVCPDETGFVAADDRAFIEHVKDILTHPELHARLKEGARQQAATASWDSVFERVYKAYDYALRPAVPRPQAALEKAPRQP